MITRSFKMLLFEHQSSDDYRIEVDKTFQYSKSYLHIKSSCKDLFELLTYDLYLLTTMCIDEVTLKPN